MGDLWQSNPVIGPELYPELATALAARAGRRTVRPGARINIPPGANGAAAALAYAEAGAEHLLLEFFPFDDFQQRMRQFAVDALPALKAS